MFEMSSLSLAIFFSMASKQSSGDRKDSEFCDALFLFFIDLANGELLGFNLAEIEVSRREGAYF